MHTILHTNNPILLYTLSVTGTIHIAKVECFALHNTVFNSSYFCTSSNVVKEIDPLDPCVVLWEEFIYVFVDLNTLPQHEKTIKECNKNAYLHHWVVRFRT